MSCARVQWMIFHNSRCNCFLSIKFVQNYPICVGFLLARIGYWKILDIKHAINFEWPYWRMTGIWWNWLLPWGFIHVALGAKSVLYYGGFYVKHWQVRAATWRDLLFSTWQLAVVEWKNRNWTIQCRLYAVTGPLCTLVASKMEWLFVQICAISVLKFSILIWTVASRPKHPASPTIHCE